ncbi:hypothetical protein HUB98_06115 [Paenibacillus barcinonensis]|uniref:Uncharacterized protein n=1 Tax=Paenibacillus barcinonensis TaxID=198119 RepID=A0A2V4VVU7_PAEBA|nr:hypothetical protein [Paenibacillus barcinonensis]PYE51587.1 hypothetical protein DFQ00_102382 [Paenibacillus barcinonensis]QKS55955.1 hypothetical protein HUB98_06115 [Paenibacillus barcinonensis]
MEKRIRINLMIMRTEKQNTLLKLNDHLNSVRNKIESLQSKVDNSEVLYESDGLQGNAVFIDTCISKLIVYDRAIAQYKELLSE